MFLLRPFNYFMLQWDVLPALQSLYVFSFIFWHDFFLSPSKPQLPSSITNFRNKLTQLEEESGDSSPLDCKDDKSLSTLWLENTIKWTGVGLSKENWLDWDVSILEAEPIKIHQSHPLRKWHWGKSLLWYLCAVDKMCVVFNPINRNL